MNTKEMIDFMLVRYRLTEAAARTKALAWLNHAQEELWYLAQWWFRRERDDFGFLEGESVYAVPAGTLEVLNLYNASGQPLIYIPHNTYYAVYGGSAVADEPEVWTHATRHPVAGTPSVAVYPVPDADYSGAMLRDIAHSVLSDSEDNYSLVPEQHHRMLPVRGLALMAQDENKPEMHAAYQADYDRMLNDLIQADIRHKRGITQ